MQQKRDLYELQDLYAKGEVMHIYNAWLEDMSATSAREGSFSDNLTLGYVTHDVSPLYFWLMQLTDGFIVLPRHWRRYRPHSPSLLWFPCLR